MDLNFTAAEEAFRSQVRDWLADHIPPVRSLASFDTKAGFEQHRAWERQLFEARYAAVSWPEQYGGRDASIFEWLIFEEEYWRARAPGRVSQNGIFLLAPTLLAYGTEEQKARYLPKMASADEIWCQGWSEPDAGSDLASLRSKATRHGDTWVLDGQKTWCSRGAFAEWCFGIFRSDPSAERHRGLTYFLIPMDAPGVTVRPIPQLDGEAGFAEIFFEGVEIPDDQVLGAVGDGWQVAMATAGSERGLSLRSPARYTEAAGRLIALLEAVEHKPNALSRSDGVMKAYIDAEAYRINTYWTASKVAAGHEVGPEASCNKIFWSETDLAIHRQARDLLGEQADVTSDNEWLDGLVFALAGPIYAGTNEIQRNVVAERLLGLMR